MTALLFDALDSFKKVICRRIASQEAHRMAALLPYHLREILQFKIATCAVASALLRQARPSTCVEITVEDLAILAGVEPRTARRAFLVLEDANLLVREHRRIAKEMHLPSRYHLWGALKNYAQGGDTRVSHSDSKKESNLYTTTTTKSPRPLNDRVSSLKDDAPGRVIGGQAPAPIWAPPLRSAGRSVSPPDQSASVSLAADAGRADFYPEANAAAETVSWEVDDSPADWQALATRAADALDESRDADENPWLTLDRIRQRDLKIEPALWQKWASLHRHRALLAVASTLLRPKGFFTGSRARYLAGILNKAPAECAPERSLARLVADLRGDALPADLPEMPLGPKVAGKPVTPAPVERPRSKLAAMVFDAVGPQKYRSWFSGVRILKTQFEVRILAPTRFMRDRIRSDMEADLKKLFGGLPVRVDWVGDVSG